MHLQFTAGGKMTAQLHAQLALANCVVVTLHRWLRGVLDEFSRQQYQVLCRSGVDA
jgi:hypothetical protein